MFGGSLKRYEILEELGKGGFGVVYKARDSKLDRIVALKFLSALKNADDDAKQRLIQEAKAASALDHVNICTVHDIGETDEGHLFIAMAHYDGETLKEKLRGGGLPVEKALDYASQIADGLHRAHEQGIVHRDIKPANVMITTQEQVKILDFGLAKMEDAGLTKSGSTLGTVAYMSPEQARGSAVDRRTDVWSLGVVLYEMISGRRPFSGSYEHAVLYSILHTDPDPIRETGLPEFVRGAITEALAKDPQDRPRDMAAFLQLLDEERESIGPELLGERKDIVVLPFRDISTGEDNSYLSDGFTEEVITDLSSLRSLRVISRSSAMRLKESNMSVPGIAQRLNVRYVLDGSVRKAGPRLRVSAQLIDAETDANLWAHRFDGTVEDVFDIQEEVARAVVDALRLELTPRDEKNLADRPAFDVGTHEAYLRARYDMWRFSTESLSSARRKVKTAIDHFGNDERLLSLLGQIDATFLQTGTGDPGEHLSEAIRLVERLFSLFGDSVHAYKLRATIRFHTGDIRAAVPDARRAYEMDPNDPDILVLLGYMYCLLGDEQRAFALVDHLLSIDPLTPVNLCVRGCIEVMFGRAEQGIDWYRRAYEMEPDTPFMALFYGWALIWNDRFDEAEPVLDKLKHLHGGTITALTGEAYLAAARGERDRAAALVTPEVEDAARDIEMFSRYLTEILAMAAEEERALVWLENSVRLGLVNYPYLSRHNRMLDGLRDVPRFEQIVDRVEEEWRELTSS